MSVIGDIRARQLAKKEEYRRAIMSPGERAQLAKAEGGDVQDLNKAAGAGSGKALKTTQDAAFASSAKAYTTHVAEDHTAAKALHLDAAALAEKGSDSVGVGDYHRAQAAVHGFRARNIGN